MIIKITKEERLFLLQLLHRIRRKEELDYKIHELIIDLEQKII